MTLVVDSSALLAILFDELERHAFEARINAAEEVLLAAPSYVEAMIVARSRRGAKGGEALRTLIREMHIEVTDFTEDMAEAANRSFQRYGKGRHKAGLNFGDCMAYALAKSLGAPLLFKGNDFIHTDIEAAL